MEEVINIKNVKSDYLYLIWKNPQTRLRHIVGVLKKTDRFEFYYNKGIEKYIKEGFSLLVSFPEINKKYISDKLFPEFTTRIPGITRIDIQEILKKYNMKEYDSFELIKRSGAKTSLDTLEFIDPILNFREKKIVREFYIAGTRYYCNRKNEELINIYDNVTLVKEPENEYDKFAIKMFVKELFVGYIPNYYSKMITKFLNKYENKYICTIIDKTGNCEECLKVRLILDLD